MSKTKQKQREELRNLLNDITPVTVNPNGRGCISKKTNKKIRGLLNDLNLCFWPDYEYTESKFKIPGESGLKCPEDGIRTGKLVHDQLEDYGNKKSVKEFSQKNPLLHEYTKDAIRFLMEYKLKPICSELPICDINEVISTRCDMLVQDEQGRFILIEWKFGYNNTFLRGNAPMKPPLKNLFQNCPLNQAYIQLLFTLIFFEHSTRNSFKIHTAFVININQQGVYPYEIESILLENKSFLYKHLYTFIQIEKQLKLSAAKEKNTSKKKSKYGYKPSSIKKKTRKIKNKK